MVFFFVFFTIQFVGEINKNLVASKHEYGGDVDEWCELMTGVVVLFRHKIYDTNETCFSTYAHTLVPNESVATARA